MESISLDFGNFLMANSKIVAFNCLILIISSCASGISIEFQNTVGSETSKSHQIVQPNSGIGYYAPHPQQLQEGKPHETLPSTALTPPPSYKYTLAYIGQAAKSLQYKPEYDDYAHARSKLVPTASGHYVQLGNSISHDEEDEVKEYKYGYRVSDPHNGAEFGHSEINDGHTVKGYYHVLLPDGRLQTVEYWAGPSGYHATVSYDDKHY